MALRTVRLYDPASRKITTIPERELSDAMVAAEIKGIDGIVYIDQRHVKLGPVRHAELSPELVERIRKVATAMKEVLPDSLEGWVEDFRRDDQPEGEVIIWEKVAGKFLLLTNPSDPPARKSEVARVLLACWSNSPVVAELAASCEHLTRDEINRICEDWQR